MCDKERMFFISNMDVGKADAEFETIIEYEVIADSPLIGKLDYGPYSLMPWEFGHKPVGAQRKLCLRIVHRQKAETSEERTTPVRYYHGGGIADEILALASLFLRRRLRLSQMVRLDDQPFIVNDGETWLDRQLIGEEANLANLREDLENVQNLDPSLHLKFILAVKLYHRAIIQIEEHLTLRIWT